MTDSRRDPALLTLAEFEAGGSRYDRCELWDGRLLLREPGGGWGGVVGTRLHEALARFVRERDLGWTPILETGFLLSADPPRVLSPDLCYISRRRLPRPPDRGFWPVTPEFVVEVLSPTDRRADALAKAGVWLAHGAEIVWVVDPLACRIAVLRMNLPSREVGPPDEADASPALPDFRIPLSDLFAGI
jgi:Uma2 family endonuclease